MRVATRRRRALSSVVDVENACYLMQRVSHCEKVMNTGLQRNARQLYRPQKACGLHVGPERMQSPSYLLTLAARPQANWHFCGIRLQTLASTLVESPLTQANVLHLSVQGVRALLVEALTLNYCATKKVNCDPRTHGMEHMRGL